MSISYAPARVLWTYLEAQGTFTDPSDGLSWPLYTNHEPDSTTVLDNVGTIFDTVGIKDGRLLSGLNVFHYGIQIRIRSRSFGDGWTKAEAVADLLDSVNGASVTMSSSVSFSLTNVSQTSPILPLGLEEGSKRLSLFVINFMVTLKET